MAAINNEINGGVLVLTLNRPEKFNSFNRAMAFELLENFKEARKNTQVRALVLTGEGKAFCAGQDLSEAVDPNGPGIKKIVEEHYNPIIQMIRDLEKPVIAAVNGVAAGAGANIAAACDIVLAGRSATFIQAFSKIGLIPDSGGTFTLPRLVGLHRAGALMMTGDKLSAEEAQAFGLVYKVFEDTELRGGAMELAVKLSEMPTQALGYTKRLLNHTFSNNLTQQLELEGKMQVEASKTYDYQEGVKAFLEKRKPSFRGE